MNTGHPQGKLTRREMLRLSAAVVATSQAKTLFAPAVAHAAPASSPTTGESQLYSTLLKTWCDGLIARQIVAMRDPAFYGGLLCPACALIHGRCGDAVYPLLRMAHTTGDAKYVRAAILVHEWSQVQVSRPDGSWINDVTLSHWQGITVFHAIALAEALTHHGEVLDTATRSAWTERLARRRKVPRRLHHHRNRQRQLPRHGYSGLRALRPGARRARYLDRARKLAHASWSSSLPTASSSAKATRSTESRPRAAAPSISATTSRNRCPRSRCTACSPATSRVEQQVVAALKTHMEFMLPDGAWDNSWGTRNYKWSWWGSRTSDGCHPGFVLMAGHDPRFREVARRNMELMAACTARRPALRRPRLLRARRPALHPSHLHARQGARHGARPRQLPGAIPSGPRSRATSPTASKAFL